MTCEDTTTRITWLVELHEPHSHVWILKAYGRATTIAAHAEIARAALAGYLAGNPARYGETFRAVVRTDDGLETVVTADQLTGDWTASPDVRQALPIYLREALQAAG